MPELTFRGTVKLHGTNASIYNVLNTENIVVQSKNNEITVDADNNGFARFVDTNKEDFTSILNVIKKDTHKKSMITPLSFMGNGLVEIFNLVKT